MTPGHACSWPKDPAAGWILEFGADVRWSPHMSPDSTALNAGNPRVASTRLHSDLRLVFSAQNSTINTKWVNSLRAVAAAISCTCWPAYQCDKQPKQRGFILATAPCRFNGMTSPFQPTLLHNDGHSCYTTGLDLRLNINTFFSTKRHFRWNYTCSWFKFTNAVMKTGETWASDGSLVQPEGQMRPFLR